MVCESAYNDYYSDECSSGSEAEEETIDDSDDSMPELVITCDNCRGQFTEENISKCQIQNCLNYMCIDCLYIEPLSGRLCCEFCFAQ